MSGRLPMHNVRQPGSVPYPDELECLNHTIPAQDLRREFYSAQPRDVDGVYNTSVLYYQTRLMRILSSLFELSGAPESWDMDYLWTVLYSQGRVAIVDTAMGVLPLECGFTGQNVFRHPTTIVIANPVLGSLQRTIDEDGVLLKLQFNYTGAMPIITRYAVMLAMCDSSLSVTLMNSKATLICLASSKQQAQTMKRMYDDISQGRPAVFVNNDVGNPANFFFNRAKENFVGEEILQVKRSIMNEFLTCIGINNANTDKRERLNTDEVNTNNSEIGINLQDWEDNIREGVDKANAMFGLSLQLRKREWRDPDQDGEEEADDESDESDTLS